MSESFNIGQVYFPKSIIGLQNTGKAHHQQESRFQDILTNQILSQQKELKFSAHALQRMDSRGIKLEANLIQQLNEAVKKAESKGSKDSMILMNDVAFIVNIPKRVVVTALDKLSMKDHVFTQIDSAIII
ncbi:TIGR02530 family flagellar biosynthesis protein [Tepidibacillus sp. LV47]|uniref:TIGR02530 family flagellar biosynthesis protein n=1 Tax=Tepidibacillus sp. LV47 TaxID=3398228 RepID=UPI003AB07C59